MSVLSTRPGFPARQGRVIAGRGVPIVSAEGAMGALPGGSRIVVVNANHLAEVRDMTKDRFETLTVAG